MKIILSHDIDHLYWKEHYIKDMYLPGVFYRNTKGLLNKDISFNVYKKRIKCLGRIHRIPELIKFYNKKYIKANFFFGMDNALHLSYNYKNTQPLVKDILEEGHNVGVHGIAFNDKNQIKKEYQRFKEVSGTDSFGLRTHYLRLSGYSHCFFDKQGYLFDSSIDCIMHPFKVNKMWEIPISIMDASLVKNAQLNQNLNLWKERSLERLEKAKELKLPYFVVNAHDAYFSDEFPVIRDWYIWLVDLLQTKKYKFVTFEQAVSELNKI